MSGNPVECGQCGVRLSESSMKFHRQVCGNNKQQAPAPAASSQQQYPQPRGNTQQNGSSSAPPPSSSSGASRLMNSREVLRQQTQAGGGPQLHPSASSGSSSHYPSSSAAAARSSQQYPPSSASYPSSSAAAAPKDKEVQRAEMRRSLKELREEVYGGGGKPQGGAQSGRGDPMPQTAPSPTSRQGNHREPSNRRTEQPPYSPPASSGPSPYSKTQGRGAGSYSAQNNQHHEYQVDSSSSNPHIDPQVGRRREAPTGDSVGASMTRRMGRTEEQLERVVDVVEDLKLDLRKHRQLREGERHNRGGEELSPNNNNNNTTVRLEKDLNNLGKHVNALRDEVDNWRSETKALHAESKRAGGRRGGDNADSSEAKAEVVQLRKQVVALEKQVELQKTQAAEERDTVSILRRDLRSLLKQHHELVGEVNDLRRKTVETEKTVVKHTRDSVSPGKQPTGGSRRFEYPEEERGETNARRSPERQERQATTERHVVGRGGGGRGATPRSHQQPVKHVVGAQPHRAGSYSREEDPQARETEDVVSRAVHRARRSEPRQDSEQDEVPPPPPSVPRRVVVGAVPKKYHHHQHQYPTTTDEEEDEEYHNRRRPSNERRGRFRDDEMDSTSEGSDETRTEDTTSFVSSEEDARMHHRRYEEEQHRRYTTSRQPSRVTERQRSAAPSREDERYPPPSSRGDSRAGSSRSQGGQSRGGHHTDEPPVAKVSLRGRY